MSTSQYPLNIWVESQNQYAPSVAFPLPVNVVGGNLVSQIIPGTGVTISPTTGIGAVTINATGTTGGVTGIEDGTTNVVTGAVQIKSADTNLTVVGNPTTNVMTLTNAAPCNATTVSAAGFSTTTQMNSAIATALGNYLELGVTSPTTIGETVLAGNNTQNAFVVTQAGTGAGQTVNNTGGGSGIGITTANNYSLNLTNRTSTSVNYQPEILGHTSVGSAGSLNGCATTLVWPIEASTTSQTLTLPAGGGQILSATNMASYMPTQIIAGTGVTVSPTTGIGAVTVTATGTAGVSEVLAGTGITVNANTGNVTVTNNGVTAITPSTGISATGTNNITLTNTGVTSLAAGSGMTVSNNTGAVTVTNNGLVSATGGTGINVTTTGTNANITNTGVTSITAGTDITVSGNTGAVTVGLNTGNIVTSIAANSPLTVNANTGAVTMSLNTSNVVTAVNAGTGISVNQNTGSVTVTNNGVTGITAGTGIATSGSGNVTVTNNGVTQINAGTGISVSSGTGSVTITNTSGGYTLDNSSTPITTFSTDTHVPSSKNVYDNTINPVVTAGGGTFAFPSTPGMYQHTVTAAGIATGGTFDIVVISGLNTAGRTAAYFVLNFLDASNNVWSAQVQAVSSVLGNQVALIWGTLPTNVGIGIYAGSQSTGTLSYGLTNNYGTTISNVMAGITIYTY